MIKITKKFLSLIDNNSILYFVFFTIISLYFFNQRTLFSSVLISIALSFLVLVALKVEKRIIPFSLIGPLTHSIFRLVLGAGISLSLVAYGKSQLGVEIQDELFLTQISYLIGLPAQIFGFWFVFRNNTFTRSGFRESIEKIDKIKLSKVALIFVGFAILQLIVELLFGEIRGNQDYSIEITAFSSSSSFFVVFNNFRYIGYILLPFLFKRLENNSKKILIVSFVVFLVSILSLGSRSPFLLFFIFLFFGFCIFRVISFKKLIFFSLSLLIASLFIIPTISEVRQLSEFRGSNPLDIFGRLSYISKATKQLNDKELGTSKIIIGSALYGKMNDFNIFEKTPEIIPHAGFDNFESLLFIFVPKSIYPEKPSVYDEDSIARMYRDYESNSLAAISLNADLYRRFGWSAIFFGNLIFGIFYGFVSLKLFQNFYKRPSVFNFLCVLLLYIFYVTTGSVLTTFWIWLWNFLKYVLSFYVITNLFNDTKNSK